MGTGARSLVAAVFVLLLAGLAPADGVRAESAGPWARVSVGSNHACGITIDGALRCWGFDQKGQLGNGTGPTTVPRPVPGFESGTLDVVAGEDFTCALDEDRNLSCWGSNKAGQLGNGGTADTATPQLLSSLGAVKDFDLGVHHACAVTMAGGVFCWGEGPSGELGDGTSANSLVPVPVTGLSAGAAAIAVGAGHSCALLESGGMKCWGDDSQGQLGNGDGQTASATPGDVSGLSAGVTAISAGSSSTCAVQAGAALCWGHNFQGKLGDGTETARHSPTQVSGLTSGIIDIVMAKWHACAVGSGGEAWCWGGNSFGEVGVGTVEPSSVPVRVTVVPDPVLQLDGGNRSTCAILGGGELSCWGLNTRGQLGRAYHRYSVVPGLIPGTAGMKQVEASDNWAGCGITASDGAVCWGFGREGQLGNGQDIDFANPVQVQGLESGVQSITTRSGHACAITTGGAAKCWGGNASGQLGNNTTESSNVPVDVEGLQAGVTGISVHFHYTCAVVSGAVRCWGRNEFGQLGNGTNIDSPVPVQVIGVPEAAKVAVGFMHSCAMTIHGDVYCWGVNFYKQLGDGSDVFYSNVAVQVQGLGGTASDIVTGNDTTCALVNGAVKCWGAAGGLGTPGAINSGVPVTVPSLESAVVAIYGGYGFCAEKADGTWWCWTSDNDAGQAGTGDIEDATAPPRHAVLLDGMVDSVSLSGAMTCALLASGQGAVCWGNNYAGQLGNGELGYEVGARAVITDVAGCDVVFDAVDVLAVLNVLTGSETGPQPDAPCDADVDNDGEVGIADALLLRRILAGTIP